MSEPRDDYGVLKPPRSYLRWLEAHNDRLARLAELVAACGSVAQASAEAAVPTAETAEPVSRILESVAGELERLLRFERKLEP